MCRGFFFLVFFRGWLDENSLREFVHLLSLQPSHARDSLPLSSSCRMTSTMTSALVGQRVTVKATATRKTRSVQVREKDFTSSPLVSIRFVHIERFIFSLLWIGVFHSWMHTTRGTRYPFPARNPVAVCTYMNALARFAHLAIYTRHSTHASSILYAFPPPTFLFFLALLPPRTYRYYVQNNSSEPDINRSLCS